MYEKTVSLANFNKLVKFVDFAKTKDFDIDLISGGKTVNAKNIDEVFTLDLTKPLVMVAKTDSHAALVREMTQKGLF